MDAHTLPLPESDASSNSILLVTNDLGPRAGGIETFVLGLLERVSDRPITIFTSSQPGAKAFDEELFHRLGVTVIRDRSRILLPSLRVNRTVARLVRERAIETVWFGAAAPLALMAPALRKAGVRRIVALTHGHEVWWARIPGFRDAIRRIGNSVDVVTYLGDFTKNAISGALGSHPQMVRIAPGIDVEHFSPGERDQDLVRNLGLENKRVIITVGRLVHRKGQDRLIQALPEVLQSFPDACLLIVGEGPYKSHLEKLIVHHHMEAHVKFVGRLSYAELPHYLRLGEIFAMPSRTRFFGLEVEGLGIVYLEASGCGLPVIAGESGGAPDAVLEDETGLTVNGNNLSAISGAIVRLLADPELSRRMGEVGARWVREEWNWNKWARIFREVLHSK